MCSRYRLSGAEEVAEFFEAEPSEEFQPRYNIAPSQQVPVIRQAGSGRVIANLRWGLVPFWARDISIGSRLINGRSETVLEKPAFRDARPQSRTAGEVLAAGSSHGGVCRKPLARFGSFRAPLLPIFSPDARSERPCFCISG